MAPDLDQPNETFELVGNRCWLLAYWLTGAGWNWLMGVCWTVCWLWLILWWWCPQLWWMIGDDPEPMDRWQQLSSRRFKVSCWMLLVFGRFCWETDLWSVALCCGVLGRLDWCWLAAAWPRTVEAAPRVVARTVSRPVLVVVQTDMVLPTGGKVGPSQRRTWWTRKLWTKPWWRF